ncbi:MAG: anthranilate phosphoribosyltransferase [Sciscionella sp.]
MGTPAIQRQKSWSKLLGTLIARNNLASEDTAWAMDQVMSGTATAAQIAGFAVGLRAKGETPAEIAGMADAMLAHAVRVEVDGAAVDVVGTGGDQAGTVNISTMAAILTAAAGVPVIKHGARATSSKSGAADVLEALGVAVDLPPASVRRCLDEIGIGFCFAPSYHPGFRHGAAPRRELGIPTAFNFLGPLTNPAQPAAGLVGCANPVMAPVLAEVFAGRGASVLLVRGDDGLDELTTTTTTTVWVVHDGTVRTTTLDPTRLGMRPATPEQLRGDSPEVNARVVRELVAGKPGAVRDAAVLNAAGAVAAYRNLVGDLDGGMAGDLHEALAPGLTAAVAAIDSGAAARVLERWAELSTELSAKRN